MTVYVDVTEVRSNTNLHPKLAKHAQKIVGLEQATGADILVTTLSDALPGNVNRPPGKLLLPRYVESGMLIQRKTGTDMLNSIPHLHNIIARMRAAGSKMSWLLITGYFFRKPENNKVKCEGHDYDWNWASYKGAIDAWQVLGGYTHEEPDMLTAIDWILHWDEKLPMLLKEVEQGLTEKPVTPKLGQFDPYPERSTLMAFPGCGDSISMRIMDRCKTLAAALEWMSQPNSYGVPGVGDETLKNWRRWMGLQEGEVLSRFLLGGPKVHGQPDGSVQHGSGVGSRTDFDGSTSIPPVRENRYKD